MSWDYNPAAIATTSLYQVRFFIGDTIANDPQLENEEIAFALIVRGGIWGASAQCCQAIASKLSRRADTTTGELRTLYSSQAKAYAARSSWYETKAAELGGGLPFAGGISVMQKQLAEMDLDRVSPQFNTAMTDNNNYPIQPAGNEPSISPPTGSDTV